MPHFTYYTEKGASGRSRGFVHCNKICPRGPLMGQQCTYRARFSSSRKSYSHVHTFDIAQKYRSEKETVVPNTLSDALVEIVSTTNMSFRKACTPKFMGLLDQCISYGFNLGKKKKDLVQSDLFPRMSRNTLQKLTVEKSEKIKEDNLKSFHGRDVYLSIDGTKLCHKSTIDVVVYGYSTEGTLQSFLLDSYEPKDSSTESYFQIAMYSIETLMSNQCRVRAFVTDGLPSQKAAFDPTNKNSIQQTKGGKLRNIFFVYCRCHLVNCVIGNLIKESPLMMKAQLDTRKIAIYLRKTHNCKEIGKLCPEPIEIRFCYDFKILNFVVKNLDNQVLANMHIPFYVYCYGIILEVLWDLYEEMEKYNSTIASTHKALLITINQLKRIATMTECLCLRNNCYRTIELIAKAFKPESDLARTAFSLTPEGRDFYQKVSYEDGRENEIYNSYEPKHQRIRNYFVFELAPILFPSLNEEEEEEEAREITNYDSNGEENEEEEEEIDSYYSQDEDEIFQVEKEEEDEKTPLDVPQEEKYRIIDVGSKVLEKWSEEEGFDENETKYIKSKYVEWMSDLTSRIIEEVSIAPENGYIFWSKMATINGWPIFAKIAAILVNIPAAEVENERIFSVKRNIVGKHSIRSKPVTITARTRVIMRSKLIQ